jgi:D-3-phosphoglycerate dehydrogenase
MAKHPLRVLVTGAELVSIAVDKLSSIGATLTMMPGKMTEERLIEELAKQPVQAILMRGNPPVSQAVLDAAPELRVIAKHGAGVDSVDLAAATAHGVLVMIAGDANAPAVAELTLGCILALGRDLGSLSARVKSGQWDRGSYHGTELRGRTLGLIGFGRIGRRVAELARCFGMRVIALTSTPTRATKARVGDPGRSSESIAPALAERAASFEALLASADIVSLHCPLTAETRGLMNRRAFATMKPGALFINTARGALVDEAALADALTSGRLAGAALDTLTEEPPAPGNPLLSAPNLIITPHIAGQTGAAVERMGVAAAENIVAVLTGGAVDRANVVNHGLLSR